MGRGTVFARKGDGPRGAVWPSEFGSGAVTVGAVVGTFNWYCSNRVSDWLQSNRLRVDHVVW